MNIRRRIIVICGGENDLRLSELSGKEIVDVNRAERLGVLGQTDLEINESTGQIEAINYPLH